MLQVYGASASPFVRKVLLTLEFKGVPYEGIPINPFAVPANWATLSPMGKIPVLVDGDVVLPDSSVICRYIEETHPAPALYPANAGARARACWLEEFADTRFVENVAPFFFERFVKVFMLKQTPDEERLKSVTEKGLPEAMSYLEGILDESGYAIGDSLSIADIAIVSPMLNGQLAGAPYDATRFPKLMSYFTRITSLPLFKDRAAKEALDLKALQG